MVYVNRNTSILGSSQANGIHTYVCSVDKIQYGQQQVWSIKHNTDMHVCIYSFFLIPQ